MNPVFWLLVILAILGLWLVLTPIFRDTGKISIDLFNRAKDKMKINDEKESEDHSK